MGTLIITPQEREVLKVLGDGDAYTVNELAELAGFPPTTVRSLINRLDRRGLVRATDRIRITDAGQTEARDPQEHIGQRVRELELLPRWEVHDPEAPR